MEHRRFVSVPEACRRCGGISLATYYRAAARGELPRPIRVTPRRSAVDEAALDAALQARLEASAP